MPQRRAKPISREIKPEQLDPRTYPRLAFPDDAWAWFVDACGEMGAAPDAAKRDRLEAIYSHLMGVNAWMNLTRITEPREYLKFHILDSLTVLPDVEERTTSGQICLDLGSGGGYPGLPLMLWLPDRQWMLVDSRQKKVAFLTEAIKLTGCASARARAFRGGEAAFAAPGLAGKCHLLLARAVGRADKLMAEAAPLLRKGGRLIVLKGPAYEQEERSQATAAAERIGFEQVDEYVIHLDPEDPGRLIAIFMKAR